MESMLLHAANCSFQTCGSPETLTSGVITGAAAHKGLILSHILRCFSPKIPLTKV